MLKPSRSSRTLAFALAFIVAAIAAVHVQQAPQPLNWAADDEKRVAELAASGKRDEGTHVVLWTPPGALSDGERRALVERLDRGVAALRELVGTHPWQIAPVIETRPTTSVPTASWRTRRGAPPCSSR